jgi:3-hydroxybutyryl-CoA dehydratase
VTFPEPGGTATARETLTQAEMERFAELTGDDNPIHIDPAYARETRFGATVAHGMHLYAIVRALVTSKWPDAVEVTQDLMFPSPARAGDALEVRAEVIEADSETARIVASVIADATEVCRAETVVRRGRGRP